MLVTGTLLFNVETFKYLETTVINKNFIYEGNNGRLISRFASYHAVQRVFSSRILRT